MPLRAATAKQPITVNGDTVEFKAEGREVVAEGNVEIVQEGSRLICDKVRVFIDEKVAIAEGHVRLVKGQAQELEGEMIVFDFSDRTGVIVEPKIKMAPYFGRAALMDRISDTEMLMREADISTCDLPHPHYRFRCKSVRMYPDRLVTARGIKVAFGETPVMYLPGFSQRLTDKRPRYLIIPGRSKELGVYLRGSYRYYLTENMKGLLHLDWYQNKGLAEGADLNYNTGLFGSGNAKYYRILEEDTRKEVPPALRELNGRARMEVRHRWDASERDQLVFEYFKQSDPDFRKDYFFREYEKDQAPKSFFLLSHAYPHATLSFLAQPRINRFENLLEKLPELKLETISQQIGESRWYYKNTTTASELVNTSANAGSKASMTRLDTTNQVSYLFRLMSLDFAPFVGHRDTYYDRGVSGKEDYFRTSFLSGMDISTKFFRIFDLNTDFMGVDIHRLRHVVTPLVQYRRQEKPSVAKSLLQQFEGADDFDKEHRMTLSLENKLQTKRGGKPADLALLIISSDYNIGRNVAVSKGFQVFRYDFEFKPYPSWEFDVDATYDVKEEVFRNLNADLWSDIRSVKTSVGYRFKKDESSQLTTGLTCPLNPFWKLAIYERFEFKTGDLVEQEYRLERDMHCWTMELTANRRENEGLTFLLTFRLKAFPEMSINAEKSFRPPRTASVP